ncbi:hypothetical protein FNV43_RR16231 [Rhamnella rubrinervis]|uniref:Uncharacterized protein n=1 Tax=Rhamnella rubrinervis TaxID=2594499 RepID=A0A8K0GYG8_9ROSA|nr:hypothetical protein FNV43_RR16231 [Rhamnella rubrinervis]
MLTMRLLGISLSLILCVAVSSVEAQTFNKTVLDSSGEVLEAGVEYYIRPAITDFGGRFTLIRRSAGLCPFYVGQENSDASEGVPVVFTPFAEEGDTLIRESRDIKFAFSAITVCAQSTAWKVGDTDTTTGRRFILTGRSNSVEFPISNYFRIIGTEREGVYTLAWCPTEVCPACRLRCGDVGPLVQDGKRFLALDGTFVLPVVFHRA